MKNGHLIAASIVLGTTLVVTAPIAYAKPNVLPGEFTAQNTHNIKSNAQLRAERKKRIELRIKRREERRLKRDANRKRP